MWKAPTRGASDNELAEVIMSEFDAIRPYQDNEVGEVIDRLLRDSEFLDSITKFKIPGLGRYIAPLIRPFVKSRLKKEVANVHAVHDFQALIEGYMKNMLDTTVGQLTISGLEHLSKDGAHVFVSNHRDIAMDPAFVNWALFQSGFSTLRIAIGDNLLTKPFASDLMRLNKCFIVNRSAKAPREKFKAAKLLSSYIYHSVVNDSENVWIAQREGRAKDGIDVTNPAIISMLMLNKSKKEDIQGYLAALKIVPVSISYEYDPCDFAKAREVVKKETLGEYQKGQHEDVQSIAKGIVGYKGNVQVAFGQPLISGLDDSDAITQSLDKAICENYILHPTNCFAYEMLENKSPSVRVGGNQELFTEMELNEQRRKFQAHMAQCSSKYRTMCLQGYANPVYRKMNVTQNDE